MAEPTTTELNRTEGWDLLPNEHLPRPTYFPAGVAMGTTFIFWGFITSLVIRRGRARAFHRRARRLD